MLNQYSAHTGPAEVTKAAPRQLDAVLERLKRIAAHTNDTRLQMRDVSVRLLGHAPEAVPVPVPKEAAKQPLLGEIDSVLSVIENELAELNRIGERLQGL